mgnify:CR=1 FL=1
MKRIDNKLQKISKMLKGNILFTIGVRKGGLIDILKIEDCGCKNELNKNDEENNEKILQFSNGKIKTKKITYIG